MIFQAWTQPLETRPLKIRVNKPCFVFNMQIGTERKHLGKLSFTNTPNKLQNIVFTRALNQDTSHKIKHKKETPQFFDFITLEKCTQRYFPLNIKGSKEPIRQADYFMLFLSES